MSADPAIAARSVMTFHHLGVACRDLDAEAASWRLLGYAPAGERCTDPLQGVVLQFFEGGGPRVELIAPLPGSMTLEPYLRGGARIYHTGYEVLDFPQALGDMARHGRIVSPGKPAVAFGGRRVSFVLLRNLSLIELIESPRS